MKSYNIPEKYKFPSNTQVTEIRQLEYAIPQFNINSIKAFYVYPRCKDGWFVVDIINNGRKIIATLGKV